MQKAADKKRMLLNGIFDFAVANDYLEHNAARETRSFGKTFFDDKGHFDAREASLLSSTPIISIPLRTSTASGSVRVLRKS